MTPLAHMSTGRPYPAASSYIDTFNASGARYPGVPHSSTDIIYISVTPLLLILLSVHVFFRFLSINWKKCMDFPAPVAMVSADL